LCTVPVNDHVFELLAIVVELLGLAVFIREGRVRFGNSGMRIVILIATSIIFVVHHVFGAGACRPSLHFLGCRGAAGVVDIPATETDGADDL
jgi:hypothetical protein